MKEVVEMSNYDKVRQGVMRKAKEAARRGEREIPPYTRADFARSWRYHFRAERQRMVDEADAIARAAQAQRFEDGGGE